MLMLMRRTPAARISCAILASWLPLVVNTSSRTPGSAVTCSISQTMFLRTSGSPPVSLTLSTPSVTNARTTRRHSSNDSTSLRGRKVMSSAMQ